VKTFCTHARRCRHTIIIFLAQWTLAAGSAEGLPKKSEEDEQEEEEEKSDKKSECFQSRILFVKS